MLKVYFCLQQHDYERIFYITNEYIKSARIPLELKGKSDMQSVLLAVRDPKNTEGVLVLVQERSTDMTLSDFVIQIRACRQDAFIICFSKNLILLNELTNRQAKLSGFFTDISEPSGFYSVINSIYSEYLYRTLPKREIFNVVAGKRLQSFYLDSILCFESQNKIIRMIMLNVCFEFYDTLASLTERLGDKFLRCHNSYLVNSSHIQKINIGERTILLTGDRLVPISDKYKDIVNLWIISRKTQQGM